ncbi:MAG: hypothetical protein U0529_15460 [Thermoanaerobaculia bacterium]
MVETPGFVLKCVAEHEVECDATTLEEALTGDDCPECGAAIASIEPASIPLICADCENEETSDWREASVWLWSDCPRCQRNTETAGEFHVVGSAPQRIREYEGFSSSKRESEYLHEARPDVWDLVIHFTSRSSFARILDASRIVAAPTGYFKESAVCLTEAPLSFSAAFRESYGPFGVVFRKTKILEVGGGPALHFTEGSLAAQKRIGVAPEAKPFINVIRRGTRRMDFHHEREWRVPHDLDLESVRPEALVLPPAPSGQRFGGEGWEEMLDAAWSWGEIR